MKTKLHIDQVYHTPPSNNYYVDPYPTMVYYTYSPYNNPYNIHTALVKNVGTNKQHVSGNFHLPNMYQNVLNLNTPFIFFLCTDATTY